MASTHAALFAEDITADTIVSYLTLAFGEEPSSHHVWPSVDRVDWQIDAAQPSFVVVPDEHAARAILRALA